jgi:F0F1-type ATP synthase assembly protein I
MGRFWLVLREGLLFGLIAGIFALIIRLVAALATNDVSPTTFADFVTSALGLLIVGGAGRKLAVLTKSTTAGVQMGALAGGISELFRTVVADILLSYMPVGIAAVARLTPAQRASDADPTRLIVNLGLDLGLAVLFGALIGWLGAWSVLQVQPPRKRQGS